MKNNRKNINRGLIVMNKGERIAVITLLIIISILLSFSVFRPALHFSEKDMAAFHNLDSLIAVQKQATSKSDRAPLQDADDRGNTGATDKASPTGCDDQGIENHYGASRREALSVAPKNTTDNPSSKNASTFSPSKKIPVLELNSTDSVALVDLPQIGEVMASRIQRYRERLGGFVCFEQLYEVKGMDSARFATVRPYLKLEATNIRKLDINRDEFKTLLRHPYLNYEQVKAIVNYRERKGLIRNWEQLREIVDEVNPLLEYYISY